MSISRSSTIPFLMYGDRDCLMTGVTGSSYSVMSGSPFDGRIFLQVMPRAVVPGAAAFLLSFR